ncbi:tetratricopeptide repeat protein [Suttonella ornithocola]|uniref:Tetratricopeptide repeat protein n=1 Tax=Suttonella ornithocola TaxID=279832 RepID=A0A380MWS9_9GAMM|nr:tetratricopeptide repeat protein [Suttonella ornithocola]SUO95867.1 tetratricopeptide repeat protein [Suttonella ornithocola]
MKLKLGLISILSATLFLNACTTTTTGKIPTEVKPDYNRAYQDYLRLGAEYVQRGRYDLAEPKLKRAIEIDSRPPEAWNILAVLYEEKRDINSGNQIYQKLINSHPDYALGFMNYATFLCKFDRNPERQALYGKMRGKGNEFKVLSYIAEGNCAREHQQYSVAENAYRQALAYDNHAPGALLPLADMAVQSGNYQAAMNYLKVIHTYVGYSADSVRLAILAARGLGDVNQENEMMRVMRSNYQGTSQAKTLGI